MADIWNFFQNLFQNESKSSKANPIIQEPLQRKEKGLIAYEKWKNSIIKTQMIDLIKTAYHNYPTGNNSNDSVLFIQQRGVEGFAIQWNKLRYNLVEITHLFDYFKEKILELNYKSYHSDTRIYTKGELVETLSRHYLKPSLKNMLGNPPFNQEFGNISIELICQDDIPIFLKVMVTHYNDRSYQKPKSFGKLMDHILG